MSVVGASGPWRCEHFGLVWTGDISNHHGIEPPDFCPGPHVADEMGALLRRLHEGWRVRRDGSLVPPPLPDLRRAPSGAAPYEEEKA